MNYCESCPNFKDHRSSSQWIRISLHFRDTPSPLDNPPDPQGPFAPGGAGGSGGGSGGVDGQAAGLQPRCCQQ